VRHLFANRNFTIFFVGNGLSIIGNWINIVTIAWLTWEFTESTLWLGIMATAQVVPTVIATPWGGILADRFPRRSVIFISQAWALVIAFSLFVLYEFDALNIVLLFAGRALLATFLGASQPSRMALNLDLVERRHLPSAVALGSITFSLARFAGPAIAGVVIAYGDVGLAFLLNALSFVALLVAVRMLRLPAESARGNGRKNSAVRDFREGISYAVNHPGIAVLFGLFLTRIVSIASISQFYAAYSDVIFGRGADGLAILTSSAGLGSLFGGFWMARARSTAQLISALVVGGVLSSAAIIVFVTNSDFRLAIVITAAYSFLTTLFFVSCNTLTQLAVHDDMRGRVMSFSAMFDRAGPAFGGMLMGAFTEWYGLTSPFLYAAGAMGIVSLLTWVYRHKLANALTPTSHNAEAG